MRNGETDGETGGAAEAGPSAPVLRTAARRATRAVIPAAGLGTRFLPATKAVPKAMMALAGRPLVEHAVEEALASGIERIVLVAPRGGGAVEAHFARAAALEGALRARGRRDLADALAGPDLPPGTLRAVRQPAPLGVGHAVWCARRHLDPDAPVAVLFPDDVIEARTPPLGQVIDAQAAAGGSVVAAVEVDPARTAEHGILDTGGSGERLAPVRGMVEKPLPWRAPSTLAAVGRFALTPEAMRRLDAACRAAAGRPGAETDLTGALAAGIAAGEAVRALRVEGRRHDCGSKAGFLRATVALGLAHPELGREFADFVRETARALEEVEAAEVAKDAETRLPNTA